MHWVQLLLCVSHRDAKMKADLQKKKMRIWINSCLKWAGTTVIKIFCSTYSAVTQNDTTCNLRLIQLSEKKVVQREIRRAM